MDPTHRYEWLLVEAVNHAPTQVQQAVAAVLGHHGPACDSDHQDATQVHNEDLCDAGLMRRRAETAEADCEWYKRRVDELEQAKHAYACSLAAHHNQLADYAHRLRDQETNIGQLATTVGQTVESMGQLLCDYGDQEKLR
jgi:HAMP domain-containing protein